MTGSNLLLSCVLDCMYLFSKNHICTDLPPYISRAAPQSYPQAIVLNKSPNKTKLTALMLCFCFFFFSRQKPHKNWEAMTHSKHVNMFQPFWTHWSDTDLSSKSRPSFYSYSLHRKMNKLHALFALIY